jgi:hypothetical protein
MSPLFSMSRCRCLGRSGMIVPFCMFSRIQEDGAARMFYHAGTPQSNLQESFPLSERIRHLLQFAAPVTMIA